MHQVPATIRTASEYAIVALGIGHMSLHKLAHALTRALGHVEEEELLPFADQYHAQLVFETGSGLRCSSTPSKQRECMDQMLQSGDREDIRKSRKT